MLQRRAWPVMGTWASLVAADSDQASAAQAVAGEVLADIEAQFSSYRADSEISRFNRGEVAEPSKRLREVLAACSWLKDESGGIFDVHHAGSPGAADVAGYVKGWAVDLAADALENAGIEHYALGVGGDWRVHGGHPEGRPWHLAIVDPADRTQARSAVELTTGALATSGTYERGQHIVVPGGAAASSPAEPDRQTTSFSVAGPLLRWADAFATIGFAMGLEGLGWVDRYAGYHGAIVAADGQMVASDCFPVATLAKFPDLAAPYPSSQSGTETAAARGTGGPI